MRHEFFGPWSVEVVSTIDGPFHIIFQPFSIEGSDSSDGSYPMIDGSRVEGVSGSSWFIVIGDELFHSQFFRPRAQYRVMEGLVVTLDFSHDFHTLQLVCTSLDPALNPSPPPTGSLIQFIYSQDQLVDQPPGKKCEMSSRPEPHSYRRN